MPDTVTIVETPRDGFQGMKKFIPTEEKLAYIRALADAGLRHLDCASFVSPKAVPQMADSEKIVAELQPLRSNGVELIAVIVNPKSVERAAAVGGLDVLGFPFSISNEFMLRNTHKTIRETWPVVDDLRARTEAAGMKFLVYVSMGFGNPYGEPWDEDALLAFLQTLQDRGVTRVALSDTIGLAHPEQVRTVFEHAIARFPEMEMRCHFHGRPSDWHYNILAALEAGCRVFDGATGALGGCPFAQDKLVSNVPTEGLVEKFESRGFETGVDASKLFACAARAREIQAKYQHG